MHVGDILLTERFSWHSRNKGYLRRNYVTKDKDKSKYFLEIEVAHQKYSVLFSQKKYTLDLLEDT